MAFLYKELCGGQSHIGAFRVFVVSIGVSE